MFKHMYSTFLMKSGSVTNINYLNFLREHMIQKLLSAFMVEEKMCWLFTVTGRFSPPDETLTQDSCTLIMLISPKIINPFGSHMIITRIHGPFTNQVIQ